MSNPKWFRYEWIWEKTISTGGMNANKMPLRNHENILIFYSVLPKYTPQYKKGDPYKVRRDKPDMSSVYGKTGTKNGFVSINNGVRYPNTLIKIPNPNFESKHPTQKPVALFEYLIKTYTNEGDLVLDNCAGSGTTGVACLNTNRNYILMEKEQQYIDVIHERLAQPRQLRLIA